MHGRNAAIGAMLITALAAAGASRAAEPPLPDDLVRALNSPSLEEREQATRRVTEGGDALVRLRSLEQALADPKLSAEQKERLRAAGLRLFETTPRAAMGVRISTLTDGPVAIVPSGGEGFDSARVLREGDVVRTADGRPVTGEEVLRQLIVSHDPDDEMTLGIVRSGEPMVVKVRLGRFSDLKQGAIDDRLLEGAWEQRVARVSPPAAAPLAADLPAERWGDAVERSRTQRGQRGEPMVDPFSQDVVRSPLIRPPAAALSVGGQTRDPATRSPEELASARRDSGTLIINGVRQNGREQRLIELLQQARVIQERAGQLEAQLVLPTLEAASRERLQSELTQVQARQRVLTQQINDLSRRIGR